MSSIDELLQQARLARQSGEFDRAEKLCRQALEINGRCAEAGHLLGLVMGGQGQHRAAVECISRAIRIEGGRATYHHDLAEVLLALSQYAEAEQSCRQALRLEEDFAAAHNTLAVIYIKQRRFDEAVGSCRRALTLRPESALAQYTLGLALHESGRPDEAAAACRRAIDGDPTLAAAHYELGRILQEQGDDSAAFEQYRNALRINPRFAEAEQGAGTILHRWSLLDEAIASYQRVLAIQPNYAQAHCNLGSALKDLGHRAEAGQCYQRALECDPALPEANFNLGLLLQDQGQADAAIQCYEAAVRARPSYAQAYNNLGTLYSARGEMDRAAECYAKTLAIRPDSAEALNNLGNLRKMQGQVDEARDCYERSLAANSSYAPAHNNRALLLLAAGDYAAGWPEYEWRLLCPDFFNPPFNCPRWRGEPLEGRTLFVHAEQGLGDTLQFIRFVRPARERFGSIKLEVQPPLKPLLQHSGFGDVAQLVGQEEPPGGFELHVPLLSLPGILGITPHNIPAAGGYLSADPRLVDHWRGVLGDDGSLKVGIAWQGKPTHLADRFRSIPLAQFAPLARDGIELVSLQKGFGTEQLADVAGQFRVRDLGPDFDTTHGALMDTAAVMKNLDLVVTADTVIAHLAGALGVETWIVLTLVPDWRWMFERSDTPWYTSVRLFRQSRIGDWPEVFERVAQALDQRKASH
jgi:tetratricopeptide (TPR) repeat protein